MIETYCVTEHGECFSLFQLEGGPHVCPVCGSAELSTSAYAEDAAPSFQMCSCGFEFGFDDNPAASAQAVEGIVKNWERWRLKVIKRSSYLTSALETCERNLKNIGIELAFDLVPVKIERNT